MLEQPVYRKSNYCKTTVYSLLSHTINLSSQLPKSFMSLAVLIKTLLSNQGCSIREANTEIKIVSSVEGTHIKQTKYDV